MGIIPYTIPFDEQHVAQAIRVPATIPPQQALNALKIPPYHSTVVVHGGAGNMEPHMLDTVREFLLASLVPLAQQKQIMVIDGATQAGVARIMGEARDASGGTFPLVGVMPHRFALYPGGPEPDSQRITLNPAHSHFIFVDGDEFGAESELIVGLLRASGKPGIALVINGGQIVLDEAKRHAELGNTIITVRGSGRTADKLADLTSAEHRALPGTGELHVASLHNPQSLTRLLTMLLAPQQV